jgi:hypothetical protein
MCPAVQRVRSVFAPVTQLNFNASQYEDCRAFLELRTADTECVPLVDARQLLMAADGRVAETGYRFNPLGFAAVANALMPGLVGVFNDLAGESRGRYAESSESGELTAAISIYNTALQSRMSAVRERLLVLNHREKTIDGCLGLDYKMLDNSAFFNNIADEVEHSQPAAAFYRTEIIGREMRVYYIHSQSRRTDIYPDPRHVFASGWYFSNREDAGLAMRATTCLYTKFGAAVDGRRRGTNMRHVGADFFGRATMLVRKAVQQQIDMADVEQAIRRLSSVSLNFSDERPIFNSAIDRWMSYLVGFRVGRDAAKHICKNAAIVGADVETRSPIEAYTKEVLAARTMYDLFCSILRYSKNQYHTTRDLLQSVAMQMLFPTTQTDRS